MAQLVYTAQHGERVAIDLPKEQGVTARVLWLQPPTEPQSIQRQIHDDLAALDESKIAQAGDHVVFGADKDYLVVIIQPIAQTVRRETREAGRVLQQGMLVHRGRQDWIVIAEDGTQLLSDELPVPMLRIIRNGAELQLGTLKMTFDEIERKRLDEQQALVLARKHCPFCGDPFAQNEVVIFCPSCGSVQHAECWDQYGGRCSGPPGCRYGIAANRLAKDTS